ncbi:MAG: C39 family peptidase [Deltaproteobacteria bacterium]|nr:C39 family peptidase [Deltaproteobacteria bacterium]
MYLIGLFGYILLFQTHIITNVPFTKQHVSLCGPAVLTSLMIFYGENVDQETIAKEIFSEKLRGTLITDMENYAKKRGFKTLLARGTIQDIKNYISQNKPVIVLVDIGFWWISKLHYLLVFGFDSEGFVVHNGIEENKRYSYNVFDKIWTKAGCVYLLISR